MPRKKSAAKKALEEKKRLEVNESIASKSQPDSVVDKSDNDVSESSSDEEEDDYGELLTNEIDEGINNILQTIKTNPTALLDKSQRFFPEATGTGTSRATSEKPLRLKDYHREMLLSGQTVDGEKSYVQQQKEDKAQILKEINDAVAEEDSDDDGFTKKDSKQFDEIEEAELPNPETNSEEFLEKFLSSKAWIPKDIDQKTGKKVIPRYSEIVEEDDEEEEENADTFENAYNFRFEDPNAAEIISYARDQNTVRRAKESSRKSKREKKVEARREEEEKRVKEINKLKKTKVKETTEMLDKLRKEFGSADFKASDLEGDFDISEWDKRMQEVFNEDYFKREVLSTKDDESDADDVNDGQEEQPAESKNKKRKVEKSIIKKEEKRIKEAAEKFVEENFQIALDESNINLSSGPKFRYREVEPESFGLTARDILLADDKQLNEYAGLKKLASWRDAAKVKSDKRKLGKKARLREWRKHVFGNEEEPDDATVNAVLRGSQ